jgi:hypothetical protein
MRKRMKYFFSLLAIVGLIACNTQSAEYSEKPIGHDMWDTLVNKYVSPTGNVNYLSFQQDSALFKRYLKLLSEHRPDPEKWTKDEQIAYWINAYNAFTVKLIIDHYPLESIKDITKVNIPLVSSPWTINFFEIGGESFNLDQIEHKILRKDFEEPRIHFAVNCASVSCPQLRNEAYTAAKLDEQLDSQAKYFLNQSGKNKLSKNELKLSKIFKWFTGDFTQNQTLIEFLNRYSDVEISEDANIDYLDYSWELNE